MLRNSHIPIETWSSNLGRTVPRRWQQLLQNEVRRLHRVSGLGLRYGDEVIVGLRVQGLGIRIFGFWGLD